MAPVSIQCYRLKSDGRFEDLSKALAARNRCKTQSIALSPVTSVFIVLVAMVVNGRFLQMSSFLPSLVTRRIDDYLAKVGLNKTRILSAQVWLSDIQANFAGMNEVWDAWAPEGQAPARATVESRLAAPELLVEIAIVAAAE